LSSRPVLILSIHYSLIWPDAKHRYQMIFQSNEIIIVTVMGTVKGTVISAVIGTVMGTVMSAVIGTLMDTVGYCNK
jgi:uncharacterized membrane protein